MKKIIQLSAIILSMAALNAYATVSFELTNESSQPIWICGYADEDVFTGEASYDCDKKIAPGQSFSANISNGILELTIFLIEPGKRAGKRHYAYKTQVSANNKDKILLWNHQKHPDAPLYPTVKKRFMGLIKSKMENNINATELTMLSYVQ